MNKELLRQLVQLDKDLAKLEQEHRDNKIVTFKSIGRQGLFFQNAKFCRLVFGSNRSGKSTIGAAEAIAHSYGYRPWLPEDHPDRVVRMMDGDPIPVPNTGFVLLDSLKVSGVHTFLPKMKEWLPAGDYKIHYNNLKQPSMIEILSTGSKMYIMSQEQPISSIEGSNGHWLWIDEPCTREHYIALTRGLVDNAGRVWITATPLKASYFMAELMERAADPNDDVAHINISLEDNRKSNVGFLDDEAVDRFIRTLRPDEVEARLHGKPRHLAGAVFSMWKPQEPYYVDPFDIPHHWPRIMCFDPATAKPMAAVWIAISPDNVWYVYREMYLESLRTTRMVCDWVKEQEGWEEVRPGVWYQGLNAEPVVLRLIDTSGNIEDKTSGLSVVQSFAEQQIPVMNAKKMGYMTSIDDMKDMLYVDQEYEWSAGPRLVVFNTCSRLAHEFINFIWTPQSPLNKTQGTHPPEKPVKANDDLIDCVRYLVMTKATHNALVRMMPEEWQ